MKHKVGDKVRVKSKEWWDAQPKDKDGDVICGVEWFTRGMTEYCGRIDTIRSVEDETYFLEEAMYHWNDEMFEDEETNQTLFDKIAHSIAEAAKEANILVEPTEDGGIKISPLEEKEEDLPIDTPVMVGIKDKKEWYLRYYAGNKQCYGEGDTSINYGYMSSWDYIIPFDNFNPKDIKESLKYNIVK